MIIGAADLVDARFGLPTDKRVKRCFDLRHTEVGLRAQLSSIDVPYLRT
jgi:hypothetical protein